MARIITSRNGTCQPFASNRRQPGQVSCVRPPHRHNKKIQRNINILINKTLHPKQFYHAKRLPENSGSLFLTARGKPTRNVRRIRLPTALFADTEAAENHAQEVVGVEFAGDGITSVLRQAQVFGE